MDLPTFLARLKRHPGQIKNILVNDAFPAGIGNAYADEILFVAGLHPYLTRSRLSAAQQEALYHATRQVLTEALPLVRERMQEHIDVEARDFLRVHGKGGQPCPRCTTPISQITAQQRLTNFCQRYYG